jgi:O-antigen ligase
MAPEAQGQRPTSHPVILLSVLLFVALAFGGGGVRYGLFNLVVQLTALGILAFNRDAVGAFWKDSPLGLRVLVGLTLLVPVAQLVPLPDGIWMSLPGRDLVAESRAQAGVGGWTAASVDPARTLVALTGMIVPLVILLVGWKLSRPQLILVGWVVVALGILSFVLGALQVLSVGSFGVLYSERPPNEILYGTFANRNSTGIYLVGCLALATLLAPPIARPHPAVLPVRLIVCALLLLAILLTKSRTALVLAMIPVALGALRAVAAWRATKRHQPPSRRNLTAMALLASLALGVLAVGGTIALAPGRVSDTLERFSATDDPREYIWENGYYSIERFWPVGAGMGTFDEVAQVDEALESMTLNRAGRAHNDYLELAIEAGAFGLLLAASWLLLIAFLCWRARRSQLYWSAMAGGTILLAIALQSITDYPLRNQAVLALAAFAMLLLANIAARNDADQRQ